MQYTIGDLTKAFLRHTKRIYTENKKNEQDTSNINTSTKNAYTDSVDLVINHPCFNELSLWKSTKIHHLNIENPTKRRMTEAYIKIICDVCEEHFSNLSNKTIDELAALFTSDNITNMVSQILHEINRIAVIESIPSIFITKNTSIVYEYLESMEETILDIQLYGRWNCKTDKVLATLDIIYTTIRIIGYCIPAIVRDMNGELSMELKDSKYDY